MKITSLSRWLNWRWIGPIAVVLVILWAGPGAIWDILRNINLAIFAMALLLAFPIAAVKGVRWHMMLAGHDASPGLRHATGIYAMGMTLAAVTPGHLGDFVKIVPMTRSGCSVSRAIAFNIFDRVLDVGAIVVTACAGMAWYFADTFQNQLKTIALVGIAILAVTLLFFAKHRAILRGLLRLAPKKYATLLQDAWNDIVSAVTDMPGRSLVAIVLTTAAFWIGWYLEVHICANALGLKIPFLYLSACIAIATMASFVPITVAGAGTRDAVFIVLLGYIGLQQQQSIALSTLLLVVFVLNSIVFYLVSILCGHPPISKHDLESAQQASSHADPATSPQNE